MNKISYKSDDRVEIVELINKKNRARLFTVFIVKRKISHAYDHPISSNEEIEFVAEYINCQNLYIAVGYELATAYHGRKIEASKIPAQLRVAIMDCLPEKSCLSFTQPQNVRTENSLTLSPPSLTTKNFPSGEKESDPTPTVNGSNN